MNFEIDQQTLTDLNLHSKGEGSVFQLLNFTNTLKGELLLFEKIKHPLSDFNGINDHIEALKYFYNCDINFPILQKDIKFVEYYFDLEFRCLKDTFLDALKDKIKNYYVSRNDYYIIDRGVNSIIELCSLISEELSKLENQNLPFLLKSIFSEIHDILNKPLIKKYLKLKNQNITFRHRNTLDWTFRFVHKNDIKKLLDLVYEWDVLHSLKLAIKKNKLNLPTVIPFEGIPILEFKGLFHPVIKNPVKNDLELKESNLCFLTGPNMSGKSTLMKSIGIAVYLAHLGYPVSANKMTITPFSGIVSSINLSDNINLGYSHYFSEVKRIKYITEQLALKKHLIVIIDEMFRGTNVEEAHYGTHTISLAFSNITSSLFFISSHIVEVAEKLQGLKHISLQYLEGNICESDNNFKLSSGISNKKLGKKILENQGIIESLASLNDRVV